MIISKKKKFVFLHCRKTAGTYISSCLYNIITNEDFIVGSLKEIYEEKKIKLSNHLDLFKFKNIKFLKNSLLKNKYKLNFGNILNDFYKKKYLRYYQNPPHMKIDIINEAFPFTENYFKFCFVRNPYDYAVSDYLWRVKNNQISFKKYLQLKISKNKDFFITDPLTNWEIFTSEDKVAVDFVGKFENLKNDLNKIFELLKIDKNFIKNNLFLKKNNQRSSYQGYYDDECKKLVNKLHFKEIEQFKYKF